MPRRGVVRFSTIVPCQWLVSAAGVRFSLGRIGYRHATNASRLPVKYYLKKHEAFESGLQRVVQGLLLRASREAATHSTPETERIHTVRKRLKRARAIHKLARPALDQARYRQEQARFRDGGRRLSEARDVDVLFETHRRLAHRNGGGPEANDAGGVRGELLRLRHVAHLGSPPSRLLHEVAEELLAIAQDWRTVTWESDTGHVIGDALTPATERYTSAFADAKRSPTGEQLHALRKRVKELGYQMDFLAKRAPAARKRLRRKADRLGELLGWHHDLWLFSDRLVAMEELPVTVRQPWERLVAAERMRVEQRAVVLAENFRRALARGVGE